MRDGNRQWAALNLKIHKVFELPMRDGNASRAASRVIPYTVFELPMRDGNMALPCPTFSFHFVFLNFL